MVAVGRIKEFYFPNTMIMKMDRFNKISNQSLYASIMFAI